MRVVEWMVALLAAILAWRNAMELFLAWYSGVDGDVPVLHWWLQVTRVFAFTLVVIVVLATEFVVGE